MPTETIENIIDEFESEYYIHLSKMPRKKIIYDGQTEGGLSVVVIMPSSTIYAKGNGWVDFTKIQINLLKEYEVAIAAFRLSNGKVYYIDMQSLYPLLTQQNMMKNDKEGEHWKLDIWPTKIIIRNGGETLQVKPNDSKFIHQFT